MSLPTSETGGFTKGPWRVNGMAIEAYTDGKPGIVIRETVAFADRSSSAQQMEANARLIAAAPDLFEALDSMLVHFARKAGSKFQHDAVRKARAALLKATSGDGE